MADLTPDRRGPPPHDIIDARRRKIDARSAKPAYALRATAGNLRGAYSRRLAKPKLAAASPAFALWASARQPSLATRATMACQAEARGSLARLRPLGFGAAAFTRCASDDGLPSRSSRQLRPPSPFGLRRGSLHSLRERRWLAKPKLAAASPAFALWASARQPSLATRDYLSGLPSRSSRQLRPPSPFGLRRGSLHSLRERRLVEPGGVEPPTS